MHFEKLCENFGVHKQVKREYYPKQIRLSSEFLTALEEEFNNQIVNEDNTPIRNRRQKFVKALNFHLRGFENGTMVEATQEDNLRKDKTHRKKVNRALKRNQEEVLDRNTEK